MSSGERGRRRSPDLSDDEHALWTDVTRSIARLRRKKPKPVDDTAVETKPAAPKAIRLSKPAQAAKPKAPAKEMAAPPLAPLERRLKQRLARGTQEIDSRLDLHGFREAEAHDALRRFLRSSQSGGAKVVLVITGKGRLGGEQGVLRRAVPLWLRLPELRQMVVGFEPAGIGHGGEGALYVRLRKLRG
jgi:DNA-nicking Smr family endonuclease